MSDIIDSQILSNRARAEAAKVASEAILADVTDASVLTKLNTVSALKAFNTSNLEDKAIIFVRGHSTSLDGGQGMFFWDSTSTSSDNGGTILIPNFIGFGGTGRWKRIHNPNVIDVQWFGPISQTTIVAATTYANGRKLVFPTGTLEVTSAFSTFTIPVHWVCQDISAKFKFKIADAAPYTTGYFLTAQNTCILKGFDFDMNSKRNKCLYVQRPTVGVNVETHAEISDCVIHGSLQDLATSGSASGIESQGRYRNLIIENCDIYDIFAAPDIGATRGTARGINFSSSSGATELGSPEKTVLRYNKFHHIYKLPYGVWATGESECDGIVWRNSADGLSSCEIHNNLFYAIAERPIKANDGDECYIYNNRFTEIPNPFYGTDPDTPPLYTRYLNLAFQGASGNIYGNTFDFPHPSAFPVNVIAFNYEGSSSVVSNTKANNNVNYLNRITVRDDLESPTGVGVPFVLLGLTGYDTTNLAPHVISGWRIDVPGGITHFARQTVGEVVGGIEAKGAKVIFNDIYISKLNTAFLKLETSDSANSAITAQFDNVKIASGVTDPYTFEDADGVYETSTTSNIYTLSQAPTQEFFWTVPTFHTGISGSVVGATKRILSIETKPVLDSRRGTSGIIEFNFNFHTRSGDPAYATSMTKGVLHVFRQYQRDTLFSFDIISTIRAANGSAVGQHDSITAGMFSATIQEGTSTETQKIDIFFTPVVGNEVGTSRAVFDFVLKSFNRRKLGSGAEEGISILPYGIV